MTAPTATLASNPPPSPTSTSSTSTSTTAPGRLRRPAALAGLAFVSAWVVGLAVHPAGPELDAGGGELALHYATNGVPAGLQSFLVHGLAAVALVVVALATARAAVVRAPRAARVVRVAGVTAAALSGVQMVAGVLAATTVGAADASRASGLFAVVARVDGVKMLALAVLAAAGFALARGGVLPRWHGRVGIALAVAMVPAAVAYLSMSATLAPAAAPALLLLLVWVCGAGVAVTRR